MTRLIVTNFNRNFTGVSATAANVIRQQIKQREVTLVGHPLPGCPDPFSVSEARALSRGGAIWHVRRNPEMRAAIWARDVLRLPIRIVFTSAAQRLHSAYPRWLIRRMDAVIATTEKAAQFVPHVRAVVPHGVDTDVFTPAPDRAAAWAQLGYGGTMGLATIGRIRPEKGTDRFVDTMISLLPDLPDARALVLGRAGRDHQGFLCDLKARIEAAGLSARILFPGEIPAQDLPEVMRALSLVVQLPRYEGYGMVPLEAMASAVPFLASDAGFYRAFSDEGRGGIVLSDDMLGHASKEALSLLQSPARHDEMSRAARDLAINRFSAAAEAAGIEAVYQSVMAG